MELLVLQFTSASSMTSCQQWCGITANLQHGSRVKTGCQHSIQIYETFRLMLLALHSMDLSHEHYVRP